jgi:hypothetical protein
VGLEPNWACSADFNLDGHMDIATANRVSDNISVLMNEGDGTTFERIDFPAGDDPIYIHASDFDLDGDCDLVVANVLSDDISVFMREFGCFYVSGDANGNGVYNGIDVIYMVNYLKGIGPAPGNSCLCLNHGMIYAAADANGDCHFNGIDVIYAVNYLKDIGPGPTACPDCPPIH